MNARYMQSFAAHVDQLPAADRGAIRAAVPQETWRLIERGGVLAWLPGEINLACTRAVCERLGAERAHEFFRSLLLSAFQTPLLRGAVEAALRIGFRDLTQYFPWVHRGFELVFRGCGRFSQVDRRGTSAVVELRGLPAPFARDEFWVASVASALSALFELVHRQGSVIVKDVDEDRARVVFEMAW